MPSVSSITGRLAAVGLLFAVLLLPGLQSSEASGSVEAPAVRGDEADSLYHARRSAMGTRFDLYLYASGPERFNELFEAADGEVKRVEKNLSTYDPTSELSRINAQAAEAHVRTDPEVFGLLQEVVQFSRRTNGAFGPTVGPLVEAALVGMGTSTFCAIGAPPDADGWLIRVPSPLADSATVARVRLRNEALSTSGSGEQQFTLDGRTYSHLLDPRTGRPVQGRLQTTVVAPRATDSDALSTALFVLGPESGREHILTKEEREALFVEGGDEANRVVPVTWKGLGLPVEADQEVGGGPDLHAAKSFIENIRSADRPFGDEQVGWGSAVPVARAHRAVHEKTRVSIGDLGASATSSR